MKQAESSAHLFPSCNANTSITVLLMLLAYLQAGGKQRQFLALAHRVERETLFTTRISSLPPHAACPWSERFWSEIEVVFAVQDTCTAKESIISINVSGATEVFTFD